jgi:hypothetical protein
MFDCVVDCTIAAFEVSGIELWAAGRRRFRFVEQITPLPKHRSPLTLRGVQFFLLTLVVARFS